ncbi:MULTISPECIES: hypothetical protein [Paenibacillus]|uniref:hypothetical protein n=1 Tax=Paenibacillus TaxID=44249 RepID=UPI0011156997|nr:hypothetical protein [Paenibacillus odorifer]
MIPSAGSPIIDIIPTLPKQSVTSHYFICVQNSPFFANDKSRRVSIASQLEADSIHPFSKWFKQMSGYPPGKFRSRSRMI